MKKKYSKRAGLPRKAWLGTHDLAFFKSIPVCTTNDICFEELIDSAAIKFYGFYNSVRLYQFICSEITCLLTLNVNATQQQDSPSLHKDNFRRKVMTALVKM